MKTLEASLKKKKSKKFVLVRELFNFVQPHCPVQALQHPQNVES